MSDPSDTTPEVAPAPALADSAEVVTARRRMKRLAVVLPIIGLAAIVVSTVVWFVAELASVSVTGPIAVALVLLSFIGPVLLVLGLHMLVWRVLVRPLARMEPRQRTGSIIGVGAVLAILSVPVVAVLTFVGFSILSPILDAVSQ